MQSRAQIACLQSAGQYGSAFCVEGVLKTNLLLVVMFSRALFRFLFLDRLLNQGADFARLVIRDLPVREDFRHIKSPFV